jgi:hypothetical protein
MARVAKDTHALKSLSTAPIVSAGTFRARFGAPFYFITQQIGLSDSR